MSLLSHARQETAAERYPRRLSPSGVASGGLARLLLLLVRAEFLKAFRVPSFVVGTVAFPVMLYLLFGLPNAGQTLPGGTSVGAFLMASFSAYGLLGIALFSFGVGVAAERGQGWLRLLRATPMPAWAYVFGKLAMSLLFGALVLVLMFAAAALFAGVQLAAQQWLTLALTLLVGALPFGTLGFVLGFWAGPSSAAPIANLVYLPLSFASGLFLPLSNLPRFLQELAPYLPTYHYGRLVWRAVAGESDLALLLGTVGGSGGSIGGSVGEHVLWLVGTMVLFGVVAAAGYRRHQANERG